MLHLSTLEKVMRKCLKKIQNFHELFSQFFPVYVHGFHHVGDVCFMILKHLKH